MARKEPRYLAWCERCWSFELLKTNSKRAAAIAATGHSNAYGHPAHVRDRQADQTASEAA